MKNVLIISASPRKGGNSDTLCDEFMRGAVESGNTAEKIFLRDRLINYCTGCGVCNSTHKCVQQDDMADIIEKMLKADVIVMSTPVYFYSMDAQLKTLIDRTVPRYTEMGGKDFYYIVTAADTSVPMLEKTVDCLPGTKEKGIIYAGGVWQKGEIQGTKYMNEAYEMGKNV